MVIRMRTNSGQARGGGSTAVWRSRAYAAINICWKQMSGGSDREDRLAWITEFFDRERPLGSLSELSDEQLGLVAGEMKLRTGNAMPQRESRRSAAADGNVVRATFGRETAKRPERRETVFFASKEQVHTLDKLQLYLGWPDGDVQAYLAKRFKWAKAIGKAARFSFTLLTFKQATAVTNALLHIAAHGYLKHSVGDGIKVRRADVEKTIPFIKTELGIGDPPKRSR